MARRVSFWATKRIRKPVFVRFRRSDGSVAKFNATKIVSRPVKVNFFSRRKRRW